MSSTSGMQLRRLSLEDAQTGKAGQQGSKKSETEEEFTWLEAELQRQRAQRLRRLAQASIYDPEDDEITRLEAQMQRLDFQEAEAAVRYRDGKSAVQAMREMMMARAAAWAKSDAGGEGGTVTRKKELEYFWAEIVERERWLEAMYRENNNAEKAKKAEKEGRVETVVKDNDM